MKPTVSSYIKSQVPEFVNTDDPVFVKLLESYYKFMEQGEVNGIHSPIGFLRAAIDQKDIDLATEVFKEYIKRQVLPELPVNELNKIDANTLIKHVKELVSIKGTFDSYQFAMEAIYEEEVKTTQMRDFIFRSSDNEYESKTILVVKRLPGSTTDLLGILGSSLVQQEPQAAAFVDSITMQSYGGTDYYICVLRQDTIFGNFIIGGKVTAKFRQTGATEIVQIDDILGQVEIENAGSLYYPGQKLNLIGGSGYNGEVLIDEVTAGGIDDCLVVRRGYGHAVGDNITFVSMDGAGQNAFAEVTAIDGVGANLLPTLELDTSTLRNAGDRYEIGDLLELLVGDATNTNPILKVETISSAPAVVDIVYGGNYSAVNVMWVDGTNYYQLPCTVVDGTVTYVPIPDVVWGGTPTFYVGGSGATGSLVTTALGAIGSTYSGTLSLTVKGFNYSACPVARFYYDAAFTQPVVVANDLIEYIPMTDGTAGIDAIAISPGIIFKGVPAGTTIYVRIECTIGSGFVGNLIMGGKILTTSIYRRGTFNSDLGAIASYNIPTKLFGTTKVNESAVFDVMYRLKDVKIADSGTGYTDSFTLTGFDTNIGLPTVTYSLGGLITDNQVKVGSLVVGAAFPANTHVLSIDSETQLTLTNNATASLLSTSLTFGGNIVTIAGGKGTGADLRPYIVDGAITNVTIGGLGGSGYSADTTIQVFSSTGHGAVLVPTIVGGVITAVTIVDCGEGYTNSDLVVATGTTGSGATFTLTTTAGVIRSIRVLNGGEDYQTGATVTITGDGVNAAATLTITDGIITAATLTNRGSAYTTATATINTTGIAAEIAIVTSPNGVIKDVVVEAGGTGYWDPTEVTPLTITVSAPTSPSLDAGGTGYATVGTTVSIAGDGIGASAIANVRAGDGKVLSVTMTSIGSGYTYADVTINGTGTGAVGVARIDNGAITEIAVVSGKLAKLKPMINGSGSIEVVEIVDPGYGYITSPTITINGGGGIGASLTAATVDVYKRQLTGFTLVPGSGYKYGTQIIVDGDGSGASLTPVVNTGVNRVEIIDGGEHFTAPKILAYEGANASAKINLELKVVDAKVKKFIGRNGVGTFAVNDIIFVGVSAVRAIKRGVVVKVEGTTANPIIHYYLQDSYPLHFAANDFIQVEGDPAVYCTAGLGQDAVIEALYANGGSITTLHILSAGSGYETNSTIEIVNLDGQGATGHITVDPADSYKVSSAVVDKGGTGYFNKTFDVINQWNSGDVYVAGEEVWYGAYQYVTTLGGTAGATPPTHTTGTVSDGGVDWTFLGHKGILETVMIHSNTKMESDVESKMITGVIGTYEVVDSGTGYVNPTAVIYNNPGDAEASVTLSAGAVSTINLVRNGVYSSLVAPIVTIIGDGVGATAHAVLASDGAIASFVVDTVGSGYTYAHAILSDGVGRNTNITAHADRPIASVTINNAGTGYNYTFLSVVGDGQAAVLTANLAGYGSITDASVTTQGTQYTDYPTISIQDVSAIGAISQVAVRNSGYGYNQIPLAVIENNVSEAVVVATSRTIGQVKGFNITDFGFNYHEVPLVAFPLNLVTTEMAYAFMIGELVYVDGYNYPDNDYLQGPHAYVKNVDLDRNLVELQGTTDIYNLILTTGGTNFEIKTEHDENIVNEFSNYIGIGSVIVGERTKLKTKVLWQNRATGTIKNAAVGKFKSQFTKSSGYPSNADIVLQDSYRYHDYAYKVTTGLSLKDYENTLKALVHPSGFKMFGDIQIQGYGEITVDMPTTDTGEQVSDVSFLLLFSLYASLFIGEYVGYLEHIIYLTVGEISPFIIKDLADGKADLTPYIKKTRHTKVLTQICRFLNLNDVGTLTFTDVSMTDSIKNTTKVSGGAGYNPLTTTATVSTTTGSGAVLEAIVSDGAVVAINVVYGGSGYSVGDTIVITGDGIGASYTFTLGPVYLAKITRSVGNWLTDSGGFAQLCSRFTVNNNVFILGADLGHPHTATDLFVKYNPLTDAGFVALTTIGNVFTAGTYTWAADTVTVTSVGHGLYDGQIVVLTFTSGDLTSSHPWVITKIDADTFSIAIPGSGTGGNVTIERAFGSEKLV